MEHGRFNGIYTCFARQRILGSVMPEFSMFHGNSQPGGAINELVNLYGFFDTGKAV